MKKLVLLLIAVCMVVTCFACGGKDKKGFEDPFKKPNKEKWEDLPDHDFEGKEFRVSSRDNYVYLECIVASEESEDIIDRALMLRNAKVEDRYNVYITAQGYSTAPFAHRDYVSESCKMNADQFDLAMTYVYESSPLITNGMLYNWAKLPYTKLAESHWINGMNKQFSVRDAIYTAISKMCISTLGQTVAMVYNRQLGDEAFGGEEFTNGLFETIRNQEWTYDKLMQIVNEYQYEDLSETNDGRTADDRYALYMTLDWSIDTWHAAWEIPMIRNTEKNGLEDVYMTDKVIEYANRMHTMYHNTNNIFYGKQWDATQAFKSNRALFTTIELASTISNLSDMENPYTILPQPKYDENQKDYRSAMFDNYSVMSIPISADPAFVSLIVEALSISSEDNVYPVYRVEALQGLYLSDTDSYEMLDIVLNNVSWDIATLLNEHFPMMTIVRFDVMNNPMNSQVTQAYNGMKSDIADALQDIMEAFDMFQDN